MTAHVKEAKGAPHQLIATRYMIETLSVHGSERREFVTFSLCQGEVPVMPEQLLNRGLAQEDKDEIIRVLRDIRENQLPNFGTEIRCRVYQILDNEVRQFSDSHEVTFVLKPLFDLKNNRPVPAIG